MKEIRKYALLKVAHELALRSAEGLSKRLDEQIVICKKAYPDISYDRFLGLVALEMREIEEQESKNAQ